MGIDMDQFSFFYRLMSSYASIICWRCFLFSLYNFSFFVKNQVYGLISGSSTPMVNISFFFFLLPSCFHYCSSVIKLGVHVWDGAISRSSFIVQDGFDYPIFLPIWSWLDCCCFQSLWRIFLGFSWELHWIYRLLLIGLPFVVYWCYLSKWMGILSIFWYVLQFPSSQTLVLVCWRKGPCWFQATPLP